MCTVVFSVMHVIKNVYNFVFGDYHGFQLVFYMASSYCMLTTMLPVSAALST